MTEKKIPTAKLQVTDPANWELEARALATALIDKGERPWFELRWPAPKDLTPFEQAEWLQKQEAVFDAVEYHPATDTFTTIPSYAELEAGK